MTMNLGKLREMVKVREAWPATVHSVAKSQTRPGNRTTATLMGVVMKISYNWTVVMVA